MAHMTLSRRRLLQGAAAGGLTALAPRELVAQQTARNTGTPGAPLPPRGEFVIRGATVLPRFGGARSHCG